MERIYEWWYWVIIERNGTAIAGLAERENINRELRRNFGKDKKWALKLKNLLLLLCTKVSRVFKNMVISQLLLFYGVIIECRNCELCSTQFLRSKPKPLRNESVVNLNVRNKEKFLEGVFAEKSELKKFSWFLRIYY